MLTPEEIKDRTNSLLEFLNNDLRAHDPKIKLYTSEVLEDPEVCQNLVVVFDYYKETISDRLSNKNEDQNDPAKEKKPLKGIAHYIREASAEDLKELDERFNYHYHTLLILRFKEMAALIKKKRG